MSAILSRVIMQLPEGFEADWIDVIPRDREGVESVFPELRGSAAVDGIANQEFAEGCLSLRSTVGWMHEGR
jgi:hypothetical protein